jgi:hypothetical protein
MTTMQDSGPLLAGCAFIALLIMAPASARPALPPLDAAGLAGFFPDGARIETRLDADLNADGVADVVAVGSTDERRMIRVILGQITETDTGYAPIGEGVMDEFPLANATLSVRNNVLLVEDLTGGTTATQSLYRYRFDPGSDRMRLIGDDVTYYSRTNQHGSVSISTNRLTGRRLVTESKLAPEGSIHALIPGKPRTLAVPRTPIYMEDALSPDQTLEQVTGL